MTFISNYPMRCSQWDLHRDSPEVTNVLLRGAILREFKAISKLKSLWHISRDSSSQVVSRKKYLRVISLRFQKLSALSRVSNFLPQPNIRHSLTISKDSSRKFSCYFKLLTALPSPIQSALFVMLLQDITLDCNNSYIFKHFSGRKQ